MLVESSEASFPDDSTRSTSGNAVLKEARVPLRSKAASDRLLW